MAGKPAGMLVFDVELLRVMPTPKGGGTPLDAAGKPMPKPPAPKVVAAPNPMPKKPAGEPAKAADGGGTQPSSK